MRPIVKKRMLLVKHAACGGACVSAPIGNAGTGGGTIVKCSVDGCPQRVVAGFLRFPFLSSVRGAVPVEVAKGDGLEPARSPPSGTIFSPYRST